MPVELPELYRRAYRIRMVERAIAARYAEGKMRCPTHLSIGQEGVAVGVCAALGEQDRILSSHRSHAHYLARGGDLPAMIAELYGKATGCAGGRGGSMHLFAPDQGFVASMPIVGSALPVAVGMAHAERLAAHAERRQMGATVVFFGDAALEEGSFHESVLTAVSLRAPVLFVCENNGYSIFTPVHLRQPPRAINNLAMAYGITVVDEIDGENMAQVLRITTSAVAHVRSGAGPVLLHCRAKRWAEHCGPGARQDLDLPETDWLDQEAHQHLGPDQIVQFAAEIERAFTMAELAPEPTPASLMEHLYA